MPVYIVTYDLNQETKRPNITGQIKSIAPAWAKLSESSYAIDTHLPPQEVFSRLRPLLDQNDNLYVIPLKMPYAGFGPKPVNEWLQQRLAY